MNRDDARDLEIEALRGRLSRLSNACLTLLSHMCLLLLLPPTGPAR